MLFYFRLLLSIVSLFFIGYLPLYFILLRKTKTYYRDISENFFIFFLSFYIGGGISSSYLIILSLLKIKYNLVYIFILSFILFIIFLLIYIRDKVKYRIENKVIYKKNLKAEETPQKFARIIFIIMVILISVNFLIVVFFAFLFPIRFWDAVSCWSLKGRAFFIDRSVISFYTEHSYEFSHLSYPVYIPLMQTWIYLWLGRIDENFVKIIFPLFYLSSIFILYYFLKKNLTKIVSILLVFIFSSIPIISDHGYIEYTNLVFSLILMLSVYFFFLSIKEENKISTKNNNNFKNNYFFLSIIFFSILSVIRTEGILYLFLFLLLYLIYFLKNFSYYKKNILTSNNFISAIISLIILVPFFILKFKLNLSILSIEWVDVLNNENINAANLFDIRRAAVSFISQFLFSSYDSARGFLGASYGPVWIILFLIFLYNTKKFLKGENTVIFIFILFGFINVFISIAMIEDFTGSIDRYLLHLFPLAYLWIMSNIRRKDIKDS